MSQDKEKKSKSKAKAEPSAPAVIPAEAGIHLQNETALEMDPGLRRDDGQGGDDGEGSQNPFNVTAEQVGAYSPPVKPPVTPDPVLKSAGTWAAEMNLATWQMAALLRSRGWTSDKQVSEADFKKALESSMRRGQGGINGRRN